MINIMYHYVRPKDKNYPNFNYLDINIFKRQLDFFEKEYNFLSKEDYISAIKHKKNPKGAILSFDDGFKDHIKYVLPELKKRNLWGFFYIPTGVYSTKKILGVHRIHLLKGKYGSKLILEDLLKILNKEMIDNEKINEFDKEIYKNYNNQDDKKLKQLLNYFIKYEYRDLILDNLMNKYFDEDTIFKELYLNKEDIKEIHENNCIVGSHTISHKVLSRLSYEEQLKEIDSSFNFLESIVKLNYKSFCYPYGSKNSYDSNTLKILDNLNINDAVVFDNSIQRDSNFNKYELSRIDCNNFLKV